MSITHHIPDHVPNANGEFVMEASAVMFFRAALVLSAPAGKATGDERRRLHALLCDMLDAARAGGFPDGLADELDAYVLAGRMSGRSIALMHEAGRCAGSPRTLAIAARYGV